jgi:spore germination protein YaaH
MVILRSGLRTQNQFRKKIDVANEYDIGGCGCWKLGFETEDIWDIIDNYGR